VNCRACGAEIADKAIVCYRCGAPTADLPSVTVTPPRRPSNVAAILVMVLIIVAGAVLIPMTRPGSIERIGAWVVAWIVILVAMSRLRRRRGR
jgi:hypothetical protein